MKSIISIFILFVLLSFRFDRGNNMVDYTQNQNDQILWSKNKKLSWDDFQGQPDSTSVFNANTSVIVDYSHKMSESTIEYNIYCYFLKKSSWTKKNTSKKLLVHEQLHFDIAELVTRKIRKAFTLYQSQNLKETQIYIDRTNYDFYVEELSNLNLKYDSETNHGLVANKQQEWEKKIAAELKKLEAYSTTKVVIKRVEK